MCFLGECKGMFSDSVKLVYFFTGLFSFDYIRIRLFTLGSLFSMRYQSRQMILRIMIVEKNVIFFNSGGVTSFAFYLSIKNIHL